MKVENSAIARLRERARTASGHARASYSGFRVGAVVEDTTGATYSGCNVENASFGLTACAERNALAAAVVAGAEQLGTLLIYTPGAKPWPPCGACRQVIVELMATDGTVWSCCDSDETVVWRVGDLLPQAFGWPAA